MRRFGQKKAAPPLNILLRWFGEVVIIVVGVLSALAVDAWWAAQNDKRNEYETLIGIRQEFAENKELLRLSREHHQRIYDSTQLVLDSSPSDCGEELNEAIQISTKDWQTYNPLTGATRSLIASGRMSLVSDRAIRHRLAAWDGLVSDLAHDELHSVARRDVIVDYIALNIPSFNCVELVGDASFKELLRLRLMEENEVLDENDGVSNAIEGILAATKSYVL